MRTPCEHGVRDNDAGQCLFRYKGNKYCPDVADYQHQEIILLIANYMSLVSLNVSIRVALALPMCTSNAPKSNAPNCASVNVERSVFMLCGFIRRTARRCIILQWDASPPGIPTSVRVQGAVEYGSLTYFAKLFPTVPRT